jgi:hypothetical protein
MLERIFGDFTMKRLEVLMMMLQKLFISSYKKVMVNENQIA